MLTNYGLDKKLQDNTCTSYYDFLASQPPFLKPPYCYPEPEPEPEPELVPKNLEMLQHGVKIFDVLDKATQWYLDERRPPSPKPRKCRYRFRVPIRYALNQKSTTSPLGVPGRRISPEFLCLLKKHYDSHPGITHVSRRYRLGKPTFSYYKFDKEGKSRPLRPGIETAAPVQFACPCTNLACPRRKNPEAEECCDKKPPPVEEEEAKTGCCHFLRHKKGEKKESQPDNLKPDKKGEKKESQSNLKPVKTQDSPKENKGKKEKRSRSKADSAGSNQSGSSKMSRNPTLLHRLYSAKTTPHVKPLKGPGGKFSKGSMIITEMMCFEDAMDKGKPRKNRNRWRNAFYNKGTNYGRYSQSESGKNSNYSSISDRDRKGHFYDEDDHNWTVSLKHDQRREQGDYKKTDYIAPLRPENSFYELLSATPPKAITWRPLSPSIHDQNNVVMPPDRPSGKCALGFTAFSHRSEEQLRSKTHKMLPPYSYLWSSVDPDIRKQEKRRLEELKCQRENCGTHPKPYLNFCSKTSPDVRKSELVAFDDQDSDKSLANYSDGCSRPPKKKVHSKDSSYFQSIYSETSSARHDATDCPKKKVETFSLWNVNKKRISGDSRKRVSTDDSPFAWEDAHPPAKKNPKNQGNCKSMWTGPVTTQPERPKKGGNLLPRLHAFAKKLLFQGQAMQFKDDNRWTPTDRTLQECESSYCIRESSHGDNSSNQLQSSSNHKNHRRQPVQKHTNPKTPNYQHKQKEPRDQNIWARVLSAKGHNKSSSPETYPRQPFNPNAKERPYFGHRKGKCRNTASSPCSNEFPKPKTVKPKITSRYVQEPSAWLGAKPRKDKSPSKTSLSSLSSGYRSPTYRRTQYPCLAAEQRELRAQREFEHRQLRKKSREMRDRLRRNSNEWFLTSPVAHDVGGHRTDFMFNRNRVFPTAPELIEPQRKRVQISQPPSDLGRWRTKKRRVSRNGNNLSCDESDACPNQRGKVAKLRRMYGGGESRGTSRNRNGIHDSGDSSSPDGANNRQEVHYRKPRNWQAHTFCFD